MNDVNKAKSRFDIFSCGEIVSLDANLMSVVDGYLYLYEDDKSPPSSLKLVAIFKSWDYCVKYEE